MPPLSLTDSEMQTVMTAAAPLPPQDRDKFLRDVAAELAKHPEIGAGLVARVAAEAQRRYFAPPTFHANAVGKHGR